MKDLEVYKSDANERLCFCLRLAYVPPHASIS